jgi:outer membrane protein TolC
LTSSRYWPQISAFFTQGWARPDPHTTRDNEWGDDHQGGITIDWPLFDGMKREGQLVEDKAMLKKRQLELLDAEEKAVLQVRQSLLSIRDAEEFVESQKMNLEHSREGLRLATVGYDAGVNTEVDITDARSALTRAQGLYYQAIHDHCVARLKLQRATGMLSSPDDAVSAINRPQMEIEDVKDLKSIAEITVD